jgi:hypothetical protein
MVDPTGCAAGLSADREVSLSVVPELVDPPDPDDPDDPEDPEPDDPEDPDDPPIGKAILAFDWALAYASAVEFPLRTQTPTR